ncbi:EamA family transporter [Ahniella affigens]|uniref:EamA family transporter n=1 Tax=Ahniella affigens TaxID=2021234 RepID=A0A2P1PWV6_9GAMM|nr:DMT family transporter [Ahniella affigens]AVP99328.1 EamA family transporter [Ahniella affigens]
MNAVPAELLTENTRRDWLSPLELGVLAAIWGASFMFQRIAAPEFGAMPLAEIRLALGAVILLPFLFSQRALFPRSIWPKLAVIGVINSAVPFALFAWAAQRAPAGIGAICNSMAVLFTALFAVLMFGERIGWKRGLALFAGFVGVVVLASAKTAGASIGWAVAAGTGAAVLYGIGANLVRLYLVGMPPIAVAAVTLSFASLSLLPFAWYLWPTQSISVSAWGSAVALGVLCTGIAYALYYRLIARIGASRAVTVTYLVPLFAVAWAWLLLGEPLTVPMAIAATLILGSVAFSQRSKR